MTAPPANAHPLLGALLVVAGLGLAAHSLTRERIACERPAGTCVVDRSGPLAGAAPSHAFAVADVAGTEFRVLGTRGRGRGATALLSARGGELRVAADAHDQALAHHARLAGFFAGEGERVEVVGETSTLVAIGGAALAVFGVHQLVVAARRRREPVVAAAPSPRAASRSQWARVATVVLALIVLAAGLLGYASYTQGTLVLTCEQRCEFAGGVCQPGQTSELSTTPGTHAIRIWDPSAPTGWSEREVTLVAGETTQFRCALP